VLHSLLFTGCSSGIGEEAQVLRKTFVIALLITAVCAVMALIWAFS
jgi:hypothetical protein